MSRVLLVLALTVLTGAGQDTAPQEVPVHVLFSVNVQDFGYPEASAAVLERVVDLHEALGVPVDVYLTDEMARLYAESHPALWERLKTSPVVAVSYHLRPPRPYANRYDWLGLRAMSDEALQETVLRYETHAVDPVTGRTTEAPGGYHTVAALLGYPPYAAAVASGDPRVDEVAVRVFRDLGARLTTAHGRTINLGDEKDGLPLRPEHAEDRLFEHVGEEAASAFEAALARALAAPGGRAPYVVGVKVHDNDFFAARAAWLTVYVDGGRRPPWDPSRRAALLDPAQQQARWALYEQTVRYVASQGGRLTAVNLAGVLTMLAARDDHGAQQRTPNLTLAGGTTMEPFPAR